MDYQGLLHVISWVLKGVPNHHVLRMAPPSSLCHTSLQRVRRRCSCARRKPTVPQPIHTHSFYKRHSTLHSALHVGMEVRVTYADMKVDDEGIAEDVFHIVSLSGKKLSDSRVKDIVERVRTFVMFCQPQQAKRPSKWRNGPVMISNDEEEAATQVTIIEAQRRSGAPYACHL